MTFFLYLINTFILSMPLATAETSADKGTNLKIVADEMECDQKLNICTATGNAFAEKLNDPNQRTIKADKFIAHFLKKKNQSSDSNKQSSEESAGKSKLQRLEAIGHVVITDSDSIIRCDRANYDANQEQAELFNNVKITNGKNQLQGSHGIANLKDSTYKITNGHKRVQILLNDNKTPK